MTILATPPETQSTPGGFTTDTFNTISEIWSQAPWLRNLKNEAWQSFLELPMPKRIDEKWRFSSIKKVNLENYGPAEEPDDSSKTRLLEQSNLVSNPAGSMIFAGNRLLEFTPLSRELQNKGVIWMPFSEAAEKHADLVKKYFLAEENKLGSDKFLALHNAFFRNGAFLYLPKNVVIEQPIIAYYWSCQAGAAIFPHTLIIAEENSKVDFVDYYGSLAEVENGSALSIAAGTIHARTGANVFRKMVQNYSRTMESFQLEAIVADRDSSVQTLAVNLGSQYARFENQVRIAGAGANVRMYSLTVANHDQEFDQRTLQTHAAPNAFSDLLYKNALSDKARAIFSGMIKVDPEGQQTDAYQTNRNLLLDTRAEANSLPGLEILADDVKCSHGATTGQVDAEQLYYLQSRGIPKKKAQELLVFGFFEEIIDKISSEELAENVRQLVQGKFNQTNV